MAFGPFLILMLLMLSYYPQQTTCKSVQKICQIHQDCERSLPFCDKGLCREIKTIAEMEEVLKITRCSNFKAACRSDTDCKCKHISMICESNECVVRKNPNKAER